MHEQGYRYQLKPLIVPGLLFLVLYPLIITGMYSVFRFSDLEFKMLSTIYGLTALGIIIGWIYASRKKVRVESDKIVLSSVLGNSIVEPADIRKIVLFWTPQKKEVAQIVTRHKTYYLSDLYFAFPELMANLEYFVKEHNIRSNFASYGE